MNGFKLDSSPGLTALTAHLTGRGALECPLFHPGCVELPGVVSSTPAQMRMPTAETRLYLGCTACPATPRKIAVTFVSHKILFGSFSFTLSHST